MARDTRTRLEIAFEGGQVMSVLVEPANADALEDALRKEEPVCELETDEGTSLVALSKVVYVKRHARETHIGFGATAR